MNKFFFLIIFIVLTLQTKAQIVSDVDGNTYNTVTIGTQIWMKENLKTTKYNDGSNIPNVTGTSDWAVLTTPGYCWYSNDAATYKSGRGGLYNWYAVNTGKLCPTGWHVPTYTEWETLVNFLGGLDVAGAKMREVGNTYYIDNQNATNSSGLSLRATGIRLNNGDFTGITFWGGWWATTEVTNPGSAVILNVDNNFTGLTSNGGYYKKGGIAVRCLKDNNTTSAVEVSDKPADRAIYPNPASDKLYVKDIKSSDAFIMIFDLLGKQVFYSQVSSDPVNISHLSNGIYLVKIIELGHVTMNKLVKE